MKRLLWKSTSSLDNSGIRNCGRTSRATTLAKCSGFQTFTCPLVCWDCMRGNLPTRRFQLHCPVKADVHQARLTNGITQTVETKLTHNNTAQLRSQLLHDTTLSGGAPNATFPQ